MALILVSSVRICHSQNYFVNTYGLFADPFLSIVCTDNCFFSVASNMSGNSGILAIKTDPGGNILWSKQINITNAPSLLLNDIVQAADGGFLILTYTQIPGPYYSFQTVIKLDPAGNFLWTRSYYSISSNVAWSIIKNNDNGFMFVGGGCNGSSYVFKCNQHGAIVWQKGFSGGTGDALNIATHDYNHFVVSGYIGYDLQFFEIDLQGNVYWQSLVSIPNQGIATFSLKPTLDNGYVATGQVLLNNAPMNQAFIVKINPGGTLSWMKIFKNLNYQVIGNDLTETSDSSIFMVGSYTTPTARGLVVKTDKNGNLLFAKGEIYQQSYSEYNSVNRYSPGKILMSGQCQNGFLPTFIAVTDESFASFCNTEDLPVTDSVPAASNTFITNTPIDLSFQVDSLPVTITSHSLTKNVLCSSMNIPTVTTGPATAISLTSATLHGSIMPDGDTLAAFFDYGTSCSYGSTVAALPGTVSGNIEIPVSLALTSLTPNTLYHYRCRATHGSNAYSGHDSVFVTCVPTVPVITGTDTLCPNSGYYTYHTQPGFQNYQWSVSSGGTITYGQGTPNLQVTWQQPGNLWIRVNFTDSAGCSPVSPTYFPVYARPLPGSAGPIAGSQLVCAGTEGVNYSVDPVAGASAYTWTLPVGASVTQGQWTNDILVTFSETAQSGSFLVSGNNLCGNGPASPVFPVTVNVKPPEPFITQSGDTLHSDAPDGNQWYYQQQAIPGQTGNLYVPDVNGDYFVIVTLDGCPSDTSNILHFVLTENGNEAGNQHLIVFPNPSAGRFYLSGTDLSGRAMVNDLTGARVYDKSISTNLLDLSGLPQGLYLLTISTTRGTTHVKIRIIK